MRFMEALTKLVVGMSRVGDHLLKRKVSGIIVAALAFACGAGLAYAARREPKAPPAVKALPLETAAPRAVTETEISHAEYEARLALAEWKNEHSGAQLPSGASAPVLSRTLESKVTLLPSGRSLVGADETLYLLDAARRVVWEFTAPQWLIDFAYIPATGLVYVTAGDNNLFILDAATGHTVHRVARDGRAGFGILLPYGEDACLVMDDFSGYRADYAGGYEPMQDGVTAWRGTNKLWRSDVPPDAELQVVGKRIYAVTKTKDGIFLKELRVPRGTR